MIESVDKWNVLLSYLWKCKMFYTSCFTPFSIARKRAEEKFVGHLRCHQLQMQNVNVCLNPICLLLVQVLICLLFTTFSLPPSLQFYLPSEVWASAFSQFELCWDTVIRHHLSLNLWFFWLWEHLKCNSSSCETGLFSFRLFLTKQMMKWQWVFHADCWTLK